MTTTSTLRLIDQHHCIMKVQPCLDGAMVVSHSLAPGRCAPYASPPPLARGSRDAPAPREIGRGDLRATRPARIHQPEQRRCVAARRRSVTVSVFWRAAAHELGNSVSTSASAGDMKATGCLRVSLQKMQRHQDQPFGMRVRRRRRNTRADVQRPIPVNLAHAGGLERASVTSGRRGSGAPSARGQRRSARARCPDPA